MLPSQSKTSHFFLGVVQTGPSFPCRGENGVRAKEKEKKKHSNEKESDGERQLVMKLAGVGGKWGETTAALRLRQGLGSQP